MIEKSLLKRWPSLETRRKTLFSTVSLVYTFNKQGKITEDVNVEYGDGIIDENDWEDNVLDRSVIKIIVEGDLM